MGEEVHRKISMAFKPHKKLNVWKNSLILISEVYEIVKNFPSDEQFGLSNQMRRSALSIASNIAEGAARQTKKEFIRFLYMAQGSLSELDTQFEVSINLGYIKEKSAEELYKNMNKIDKMLSGLIKSLRKT